MPDRIPGIAMSADLAPRPQRYLTAALLALFIAALALIAPTPSQAAPAPIVAQAY
jgi:hypothetical protein